MNKENVKKQINYKGYHNFESDIDNKEDSVERLEKIKNYLFLFGLCIFCFTSISLFYTASILFFMISIFKSDLFFDKAITYGIMSFLFLGMFLSGEISAYIYIVSGLIVLSKVNQIFLMYLMKNIITKKYNKKFDKKYAPLKVIHKKIFRHKYKTFEDFILNLKNIEDKEIDMAFDNYQYFQEAKS